MMATYAFALLGGAVGTTADLGAEAPSASTVAELVPAMTPMQLTAAVANAIVRVRDLWVHPLLGTPLLTRGAHARRSRA